ncbi:bifunctional phosphoglucose/phosphomannose isomerase [candidate division WOR-3 bacterium]|uniref:Bifunctional phosphoglucose/phosphomannose isomerase n=1 Tax=candidate division WOR-3 bacterium TaxID=2052148 RepID=A0A9D5KAJ4_UNCW3|nr:bifunctional phosphoglucose/phosphomannose isomerase [candidate division WOR-3 bacterium]MBD3364281.1 bifunctional phosphoglucose/phosphomannose isomerase [candidate division WOR-3 bacterium]
MLSLVRSIPDQLEHNWKQSASVIKEISKSTPAQIAICGMGGSGISGDLIRGLLLYSSSVPLEVVKDYSLPTWIRKDAFAVVISYSGNTEETLSLWDECSKMQIPRLALSSGGRLTERALSEGVAVIKIPPGYPPRASIGYLFSACLRLVHHWGLYPDADKELFAATALIRSRIEEWCKEASALASSLKGRFPLIHSLDVRFAPLAYRMVCELNENAKELAHFHTYSEMNHNELNGFEGGVDENAVIVILDAGKDFTHPRNQRRAEIIEEALPRVPRYKIKAEGETLLERMLSLLIKGDLVSVYLAEFKGIDPEPVNMIENLKRELG